MRMGRSIVVWADAEQFAKALGLLIIELKYLGQERFQVGNLCLLFQDIFLLAQ